MKKRTSKCAHFSDPLKPCHAWCETICAMVEFAIIQTHKHDELQKFSTTKLLLWISNSVKILVIQTTKLEDKRLKVKLTLKKVFNINNKINK